MSRRAWTMLELVITIALGACLMACTFVSFRRPASRASSRGLAEQVAEAFRAARNLAMAEQSPVALLIPAPAGSTCSQSIAFLRGQDHPTINRVLDYHREFPKSVLFVGTYPASSSWSIDPVNVGRTHFWESDLAGTSGAKPLLAWLGSRSDNIFLFTPDGSIHSNDVPHVNENYCLVVSQGVVAASTAAPSAGLPVVNPPPYNALSQVCDPYTVVVGCLGSVRVVPGLADNSGGVVLSPSALPLTQVAPAPLVVSESVTNPTLLSMNFNPQGAAAGSLGVAGTLDPSRQVQVNVRASIPTSDDLFCTMSCTGVRPLTGAALPGGTFSNPGSKRMYFIPPCAPWSAGDWVSSWQWNPPPFAQGGDRFTFDVTITTRRGGVVTSASLSGAARSVEIFNQGKIFFGAQDPYPPNKIMIYSIRADGTDLTRVTNEEATGAQLYPAATRDGNKLLFCGAQYPVSADLFALSRTGGLSTRLTNGSQPAFHSHFADDSAVGVFEGADAPNGDYELYCFDPNSILWPPNVAKIFVPSPSAGHIIGLQSPSISGVMPFTVGGLVPASTRRCDAPRRLAFEGDCASSGTRAIYTCNFCNAGSPIDGSTLPGPNNIQRQTQGGPGTIWGGGDRFPCWHPSGNYLAFQSDRDGGQKIYKIAFDDNGHPSPDLADCLTPTGTNCIEPYYSPNGQSMCWLSNDGGPWDIYIANLNPDGSLVAGTTRSLNLAAFTPFTGGFPNMNRPVWTQ